jgi:hypothetical protein
VGTTVHPGAALAAVAHPSSIASVTDVSTSRRRRFRSLPDTTAPLLAQLRHRPNARSPYLEHVAASHGRRMVGPGGTVRPGGWPDIGRCA